MFPIICKIGPATVYSYGLMLAVAVVVCAFLLSRDAQKEGMARDVIFDLTFWTVIAGILGARFFFIFLNLDFFLTRPLEVVMIQNGGLAWQGGLVFGALGGIFFIRKKGLPFLRMLDLSAPYLALGQAIGRLGCFLNGCCYGKEVPWGIFFPVHHTHLHPTQLYSAGGLVVLFFILKHCQKNRLFPGSVFVSYAFWASLLRFCIEFFRADYRALWLGLSIFQWVCLCFMAGSGLLYHLFKTYDKKSKHGIRSTKHEINSEF